MQVTILHSGNFPQSDSNCCTLTAHSPMKAALDVDSAASGVLPFLVFVPRGLMERAAV
jgi:hypothetical protein